MRLVGGMFGAQSWDKRKRKHLFIPKMAECFFAPEKTSASQESEDKLRDQNVGAKNRENPFFPLRGVSGNDSFVVRVVLEVAKYTKMQRHSKLN